MLAVLMVHGFAQRVAQLPAGYAIRTQYVLDLRRDGTAGRIELLEDARIHPGMRDAIGEAWGEDPCRDAPAPVLRSLCTEPHRAPLRPALLRLLDAAGRVVAVDTAKRPLASLAVTRLYASGHPTYLFTVDLSAGFGSYSGPYTRLAEPTARGFGWVTAVLTANRSARDTVTLVETLKTAWRFAPRRDGRGNDLLTVGCRPVAIVGGPANVRQADADGFMLTFHRYTFDGRRWVRYDRAERGFWENEGPDSFPARARFP
jgi:hypothetical protein